MPRITISEPGKTSQPYRLKTDRKSTKIGRATDNDIILGAGSASTYHCEMKRVEGGFILEDNNSTNGIKLEDARYTVIDLVNGMNVKIGDDINFHFELSDEELEILADEDSESHQQAMFPKSKEKPVAAPIDLDDDIDPEPKKRRKEPVDLDQDDDTNTREKLKDDTSRVASRSRHTVAKAKTNGFGSTLLFIILAILFLVAGMAIRHWVDYQTFIFDK